jgi:hypothetical protein
MKVLLKRHYDERPKFIKPGIWDDEFDEVYFEHNDMACLARRDKKFGYWFGFVSVSKEHKYHTHSLPHTIAGGMPLVLNNKYKTFGDMIIDTELKLPKDPWWFGFSFCNHPSDFWPSLKPDFFHFPPPTSGTYTSQKETIDQTVELADLLFEVRKK